MKFTRIAGFGDSWMWGDELLDPALVNRPDAHPILVENTAYREQNCFLGRLGEHYNVPVTNFGIPGGSLQSSIWCFLWWLKHGEDIDNTLVLVAHTDANRHTFYNPNHVVYANDPPWNRFVHSAWVHSSHSAVKDEWSDMVKRWTVLTDCTELTRLNYQQAVWFFEGQRALRNNLVLQFCSLEPPMLISCPGLLWPDQSLRVMLQDPKYLKTHGHPNELGHEVIRDRLIYEINCAIIDA